MVIYLGHYTKVNMRNHVQNHTPWVALYEFEYIAHEQV